MTTDDQQPTQSAAVGRRGLIGGLAVGGAAVGGGAVGALGARAMGSFSIRRETLSVEVACLGELWREAAKANPEDDADFRTSFGVEGWIYPVGTIKGDGFIPTPNGAIGHWFCRGIVLIDANRAEPHTSTSQELYFGMITPSSLFPPDMISTSGLEGTLDRTAVARRSIVGGTGRYGGAIGESTQQLIADNTSLFADGTNDPGPCWRMDFMMKFID